MTSHGREAGPHPVLSLLAPPQPVPLSTPMVVKVAVDGSCSCARISRRLRELSEWHAMAMMQGLVPVFVTRYGVVILEETIRAAVTLSHRYITARQLSDKAIVILLKQADRILGQALIGSSAHDSLESDAGLASEGLIHLPDAFALFATY
jgi:hypothetical protein